ncbi:MAG: carboxypeptidase regulatory-like domain-containing protein [Gemmatimonadetes bacterium]|nr:carboxypeptidase regulatory-like domain-containing protein [Gemmatimonadota bacterium]
MRCYLLAAVLMMAASPRVDAQAISGVVRDSMNAEPLAGTTVELFSVEGRIAARDITDQNGLFSLEAPSAGSYRLRFQRIGYRGAFSAAFAMAGRDTTVSARLLALAVTISPVIVSASTQTYLTNAGFVERKKTESGYFLDPIEVDKRSTKAKQTADLLDGIPGVTLLVAGGSWGIRVPALTRQMGCDMGPRIYVDGNLMNPFGTTFDVNTINATEIAAIELYRSVAQVPLKFGGNDAVCGVVVIWTKH